MDEFDNAFQGGEDPAAEFLAREQSELEELGIEDQLGVQQVRIGDGGGLHVQPLAGIKRVGAHRPGPRNQNASSESRRVRLSS